MMENRKVLQRISPFVGVLLLMLAFSRTAFAEEKPRPWAAEIEEALVKAGKNRPELEKALNGAPVEQRKGMAFLVANMPDGDLKSLGSAFLLENLALAYKARNQVAWGKKIPEQIFLNNV